MPDIVFVEHLGALQSPLGSVCAVLVAGRWLKRVSTYSQGLAAADLWPGAALVPPAPQPTGGSPHDTGRRLQ